MMKSHIILLFFLLACTGSYARPVSGKVWFMHSSGKEPASFASIYLLESKNVAEAGKDGGFVIDADGLSEITLVAAYVGYTRDTVKLAEGDSFAEFELYPENELGQIVITGRQSGNYLSKVSSVRTEVISSSGLAKMACCTLAESFENSASVSVGYSDAVTGAKQIMLLGLSGKYTAMLDENRPVMRCLASPFGLSYIPGQWLESIQIAKGPSSVVNGLEAITGQINMEYRKPLLEQPLFLNLFLSSMLRTEINAASSLQINDRWSTVMLGHFSTDPLRHDGNGDGFRDEPNAMQFNIANRWLHVAKNGIQTRFGFSAVSDDRLSGQVGYGRNDESSVESGLWGSDIRNKGVNAYMKVGIPISGDDDNFAVVADYTFHRINSSFGMKEYDGIQNSAFLNAMFQSQINEHHKYVAGISAKYDNLGERLRDFWLDSDDPYGGRVFGNRSYSLGRAESSVGAYGEYTYTLGDKFTAIAGLRLDYDTRYGFLFAPRANIKYSITENLVFRANGGRGFRTPNIICDNLGVMSTGSRFMGVECVPDIEDAWTYGGNLTVYFKLGYGEDAYFSFDYFRTDFMQQFIVDYEKSRGEIWFYNLDGKKSFTNTYQIDFSMQPVERFTVMLTARYTDAKVELEGQGIVDRPLMSKFKGVLNLQYATRMNKWTFDFTAQLNGPARLPQVSGVEDGYSPWYPLLFAQVTRKFKGFDVYLGVENILNYKQKDPIIDYQDPYSRDFNAAVIWGPLMGIKVYAGMKFTLWKK